MAVGCASTSPWDLLEWSQFLGTISCRMTVKQDKLGKKDAFLNHVYMLKWNFLIDYTKSMLSVFFL